MAGEAGVVIIDGMRGDAVDQRAFGCGRLQRRDRRVGAVMHDAEAARRGAGHRLVPARDHAGDTVGETEADRVHRIRGQSIVAERGDEAPHIGRQSHIPVPLPLFGRDPD